MVAHHVCCDSLYRARGPWRPFGEPGRRARQVSLVAEPSREDAGAHPPAGDRACTARGAALGGRTAYCPLLRAMPLSAEPSDAQRRSVEDRRGAHGLAHAGQWQYGSLMKEMMDNVETPSEKEVGV